jgi:multidrug efflux pump subunit AcrB
MGDNKKGLRSNTLVTLAINNFHFVVVACLIVLILGLLAIFKLPKDLLPSANLPAVQVISFYPGMPVKDVEQTLTARFERNTGQAIGMQRQESKSLVGVSIVKNFFTPKTDQNFAISQTTSLVISVLGQLPPGTLPPYIIPFDPMAAVPLALVVVNQNNKSIEHIYDTARYEVRNAIQAVQGAMAPTVMGGTLRQVVIFLDPKLIKYYNFSPLNVLNKMMRLNSFIPSGDVKIGDYDYQIESNALVKKISDMNDFPLRGELGVPVFVRDIGCAADSGLIQTNVVLIDGNERVYVPVYRQPGGNTIQIVDHVKTAIKHLENILKATNPTKLTLVADQSTFIRHAIKSITQEALLGGGLAALMIFLFLANPRSTFGILLSLPLSLLFAFIGLEASNQSINAMTLGGLALSIGVLVDNSIVVLENINKKLEAGKSGFRPAIEGASEVAMPVFASTTATLVVLFPVVFLTGIVKILFSALAIAVIFVMIGSYIAAMTVMPLFASRCLKPISVEKLPIFFAWTHNSIQRLTKFYGKVLMRALHFRKTVLVSAICLFLVGLFLAPLIGTELFPRADAGSLTLDVRLASGKRIEITTSFAKAFDKKLREWIEPHDLHMIIANAGVGYGFPAAFTPNVGTQDVFFDIELTKDRYHTSQYYAKLIREHVRNEFPNIEMGVELGGLLSSALNMGLRAPIDIEIEGPDLKESFKIGKLLVDKIKKIPGAVDVRVQQRFDDPLIYIDINRKKAMSLGIFTDEIVKNIDSAVTGSSTFDTSSLWVDPKTGIDYFLAVQIPPQKVSSFKELNDVLVRGFDRNRVLPLKNIAKISKTTGWTQINHVNFRPVINVYLDAQDRDIGGLAKDVAKVINQTHIPQYYTANIRGEVSEMKNSIKALGGGFILAAILVYLILVVQFRSFLQPLIIMVTVPLGLIGIVFMLLITNTYFSIQAAIGAIFMIGIAVANGVLLIEFITHQIRRKSLSDIDEAIVAGAKARLRPILMTSLAAILGLVPMAIGIGHGSEANIPLGRAVIGGQLVSMLMTLFIIPVLYHSIIKNSQKTSNS